MKETAVEALLDELCSILHEELEQQENLLAVSTAQRAAIVARDAVEVELRAAAMQVIVRDVMQSEARRLAVVADLAADLQLSPRATLSHLAAALPEPWRGRLTFLQGRLREVMEHTRQINRENAFLLRRSLRMVDQCLRFLQPDSTRPTAHYTSNGQEPSAVRNAAAFVNQKG